MTPEKYREIEARVRAITTRGEPLPSLVQALGDLIDTFAALGRLLQAIADHRAQRADDRCIEDDDKLYAALEDGVTCDRRVGSKEEMYANCQRFIQNRCQAGGPWKSYARLEEDNKKLRQAVDILLDAISDLDDDEREAFDEESVEAAIQLRHSVDSPKDNDAQNPQHTADT